MKSSIGRSVILLLTDGAHGEFTHGGCDSVVGHVFTYGIARAAIRAVSKRVLVASVFVI